MLHNLIAFVVSQAPTPPTGIDWTQIILQVLMGLGAVVGTIVPAVLVPALRSWLQAQANDKNASTSVKLLANASLKLESFIEAGIADAWKVFDADMRAARDEGSDGGSKVTPAELEKAKADVLAAVKGYLGTAGLAQLSGVLGFGGEMLEQYLKAQVEKKVQAAQEAGSAAAASVSTGEAAAAALSKL